MSTIHRTLCCLLFGSLVCFGDGSQTAPGTFTPADGACPWHDRAGRWQIADLPEALAARRAVGDAVAYVCRGMECSLPIGEVERFRERMGGEGTTSPNCELQRAGTSGGSRGHGDPADR